MGIYLPFLVIFIISRWQGIHKIINFSRYQFFIILAFIYYISKIF